MPIYYQIIVDLSLASILKPNEPLYSIAKANCIFKYFKNADIANTYILKINSKDILNSQYPEKVVHNLSRLHIKLAGHYVQKAKEYRDQDAKMRDFTMDLLKSESERIEKVIDDYTKNACKEILQILRDHNSKDTTFIEKLSSYIGENNDVLSHEHNSNEIFGLRRADAEQSNLQDSRQHSSEHVEQSNQTNAIEDIIGSSLLGGFEIADNYT